LTWNLYVARMMVGVLRARIRMAYYKDYDTILDTYDLISNDKDIGTINLWNDLNKIEDDLIKDESGRLLINKIRQVIIRNTKDPDSLQEMTMMTHKI